MDVPVWQRLISLVGLFAMVAIAWLLSKRRDRMPWRVVGYGIGTYAAFICGQILRVLAE